MTLVLELPLPPNMANSRMHWAAKNREKGLYFSMCTLAISDDNGRIPRRRKMSRARITLAFRLSQAMDTDNLMARAKWPIDWLRHLSYIADDSPKHLEWSGLPTQTIDRKNTGLTITLERL